ncbi:MAG: class I SAM-dependent methyltransferase [Chloroflexota bacterium]
MKNFDPINSWNDKEVAARYAEHLRGDEDAAVRFLTEYVNGGRALEFAIGTGRIAIPLFENGVQVDGIEGSSNMVEQLKSHPSGSHIDVKIGDMSNVSIGQHYNVVYLVYNTIFNLLTAEAQIQCFENAARHLSPNGSFIVETALPHTWIDVGKSDYVKAEHVGISNVTFDVAKYDPVTQLMEENHVHISENGISMNPIVCRLISPGEMDLMARISGMKLIDRFANWEKSPFDANSTLHISVYSHA